jgi:predicted MPP superfamily phosphohydrolase
LRRFAGPAAHVGKLSHLRVAHLTDLHVGRVTPLHLHHTAVRITNAEDPDLVVITGDFVCHSQLYLDALSEVIAGFSAPVVCVLGNHDHWSGASEVRWSLRRAGAEVLDNQTTTLTLRGQRLQLVGLDDAYTGHARWREAVKGIDRRLPALGLSHIAEEADALWQHGVPLVLSGHTHAGQLTFARMHELAVGRITGHKYVHGLYGARHAGGAVYVGAGIGSSLVPLRLGERARREITVFELGHEPGSFEEPLSEQRPLAGRKPTPRQQYRRMAAVVKNERRRARALGPRP